MATKNSINTKTLRGLEPLRNLSLDKLEELAEKSTISELPAGRILFRQGERDKRVIFLLQGQVELAITGNPHPQVIKARTVEAKHPIAPTVPRPSTGKTKTPCTLLFIDSDLLEVLSGDDNSSIIEVEELGGDDENAWMLRFLQSRAFLKLPTENIQNLLIKLEEVPASAGDVIIAQGEVNDYYYIVQTGRCAVSRRPAPKAQDVQLAILNAGDGFGEEALITGGKRNATITMLDDGILMRLGKKDFMSILARPLIAYVNRDAALEKINAGSLLIDVRQHNEFMDHRVEGSVNIPLSMLRLKVEGLNPDREYVLLCDDGHRSAAAAFLLTQHGLDCYVLKGGLNENELKVPDANLSVSIDSTSENRKKVAAEKTQKAAEAKAKKIQKEADTAKHEADELAKRAADVEAAKRKAEADIQRLQKEEAEKRESALRATKQRLSEESKRAKAAEEKAAKMKLEAKAAMRAAEAELKKLKSETEENSRKQAALDDALNQARTIAAEAAQAAKIAREQAEKEAQEIRAQAQAEAEQLRQEMEDVIKRMESDAQQAKETQTRQHEQEMAKVRKKAISEAESIRVEAREEAERLRQETEALHKAAEEKVAKRAEADAARIRNEAREEAEQLRREAEAIRKNAEKAAEEKVARRAEAEAARIRQQAREEAEQLRQEAEAIRKKAEQEAAKKEQAEKLRQQALEEAEQLRLEMEAERETAKQEAARLAEQEAERIRLEALQEAEQLRDEIAAARAAAKEEAARLAEQEAARIRKEARLEADQLKKAARSEAQKEAARQAEKEAERIRREAEQEAERLRKEAQIAAEQEAARQAEKEAERIRREAELEALRLREEAQLTAEQEATRKAEEEAERIRRRAEQEAREAQRQREEAILRAEQEAILEAEREAEQIRLQALEEAEQLRAEMEAAKQEAQEIAAQVLEQEKHQKYLLEQARRHAEDISRNKTMEAEQEAESIRRTAAEEATSLRDEIHAARKLLAEQLAQARQETEAKQNEQKAQDKRKSEEKSRQDALRRAENKKRLQAQKQQAIRKAEEMRRKAEAIKARLEKAEKTRQDEAARHQAEGMSLADATVRRVKNRIILEGSQDIFIFKEPTLKPEDVKEEDPVKLLTEEEDELPSFLIEAPQDSEVIEFVPPSKEEISETYNRHVEAESSEKKQRSRRIMTIAASIVASAVLGASIFIFQPEDNYTAIASKEKSFQQEQTASVVSNKPALPSFSRLEKKQQIEKLKKRADERFNELFASWKEKHASQPMAPAVETVQESRPATEIIEQPDSEPAAPASEENEESGLPPTSLSEEVIEQDVSPSRRDQARPAEAATAESATEQVNQPASLDELMTETEELSPESAAEEPRHPVVSTASGLLDALNRNTGLPASQATTPAPEAE